MSYKFPRYRCDKCGVVRDDPDNDTKRFGGSVVDDDSSDYIGYECRIAYVDYDGIAAACGGSVKPWAYIDSDSYITMKFP